MRLFSILALSEQQIMMSLLPLQTVNLARFSKLKMIQMSCKIFDFYFYLESCNNGQVPRVYTN